MSHLQALARTAPLLLAAIILACEADPGNPSQSPVVTSSPTVMSALAPATTTPVPGTIPRRTPETPATVQPPPSQTGNLAPNSSFEEGGAGVAGWRRLRIDGVELPPILDTAVAHSGQRSLKLERRLSGDCPSVCGYWTSAPIPIDPGASYTFSAWFRVSSSLSGPISPVLVAFRVVDANGEVIGGSGQPTGLLQQEWRLVTLRGSGPLPAGAAGVILDIAWLGNVGQDRVEGEIWIDDVFFGPSK